MPSGIVSHTNRACNSDSLTVAGLVSEGSDTVCSFFSAGVGSTEATVLTEVEEFCVRVWAEAEAVAVADDEIEVEVNVAAEVEAEAEVYTGGGTYKLAATGVGVEACCELNGQCLGDAGRSPRVDTTFPLPRSLTVAMLKPRIGLLILISGCVLLCEWLGSASHEAQKSVSLQTTHL